jgi:XapX domain-containing protein
MKPYLLSLGAGLLVGVIYSLLHVRSPAPPAIALVGLLGMLLGEQAIPIAKRLMAKAPVVAYLKAPECAGQVLGPQAVAGAGPEPQSPRERA